MCGKILHSRVGRQRQFWKGPAQRAHASNPDDFKLRVAGIVGSSDRGWKEFEIESEEKEDEEPDFLSPDQSPDEEPPLAENRGFNIPKE